jgi:hypothetical protein
MSTSACSRQHVHVFNVSGFCASKTKTGYLRRRRRKSYARALDIVLIREFRREPVRHGLHNQPMLRVHIRSTVSFCTYPPGYQNQTSPVATVTPRARQTWAFMAMFTRSQWEKVTGGNCVAATVTTNSSAAAPARTRRRRFRNRVGFAGPCRRLALPIKFQGEVGVASKKVRRFW